MTTGLSKITGQSLAGNDHLAQSIGDILSTPLGTRVMRRDYGSLLFDLIDAPLTPAIRALVHAATALALSRWESRIRLTQVTMSRGNSNGELSIEILGDRTDLPSPNSRVSLSIPIRRGGATTGTT